MTTTPRRLRRTISIVVLTAVGGMAAAQEPASRFQAAAVQPASQFHARKQPSRAGMVSVIVKLESDSLAAYRGGLPGLAATSLEATRAARLDVRAAHCQKYLRYLDRMHREFEQACSRVVPEAISVHHFKVVFGGVSVLVPADRVDLLATVPGVKAVYRDEILEPATERSPAFIGANRLWRDLGGRESAGEGVVVGVLDTGIWPEHPSFSDPDPDGKPSPAPPTPPLPCDFGNTGFNPNDAPFTCNNKLIGAYEFLDTYKAVIGLLPGEFDSARDDNGHGTHTSSTAAGNGGVPSSVLGIPRGLISGIAPRAHVIMYRVCADQGCFASDSTAAVEQAILDGVDVINFSIGGGSNPYSDGVELAFLDAYDAGVFVAASAGNGGPGADTVSHRGPWTATVAASTTDRHFLSDVTLTGDDASMLVLTGATVTEGISAPTPVVFPPPGEELCLDPFAPGTFSGEIVICQRGVIARVAKSFNVAEGGATGLLLYNPVLQGLATDNHFIPSVQLENDAGQQLLDFMATHTGVMATFTPGIASEVEGDVMASFSSRGGPGQTLGVSKPDITAPGVQILAGHSPLPATVEGGLPGELFQVIQGTSMSSPHVAGAAALLKDLWATWTPGQIKSALMTTARMNVVKEDGITKADAFDFGSGRLDLRRAGDPGITFDEEAADYLALETHLWDANYPSLYLPANPGTVTVQRTARSQIPHVTLWRTSVVAPDDVKITVPPFVLIPGNGEATFDITVDARNVPEGETRFAHVGLRGRGRRANFPITLVKRDVDVVLDKECSPTSLHVGTQTDCTITLRNDSFSPATVHLEDRLPRQLKLVSGSVVGAVESENGVVFDGVLMGPEPPDVQVANVPGSSPAGGFLPLSIFGVPPIAGVGDETLVNFNVPDFRFAGETWNRVGMVSNGYLVVGGGTGADIDFINQSLPDATPPNNVIAPFWTDLNPADGGALRVAALTDGVNTWLVFEWENVPNFSVLSQKNSFQAWIGIGAVEDITMVYGETLTLGEGGFLTVGAENKFGNRGENAFFDGAGTAPSSTTELVVSSTPGAPAPPHTIQFGAFGRRLGPWQNCAELSSTAFAGRTVVDCVSGDVTRP